MVCVVIEQLRRQSGVALILVLWITVLLTVVVGSFVIMARTENLQARHLFESSRARYLAEAGLHYVMLEMRNPDPETRWVADGRPYEFEFEGTVIEIEIIDETGKIDINVSGPDILAALFDSLGMDELERNELVDAIQDWRDPDDLVMLHGAEAAEYEAADYPYVPRNANFETLSELQQVMGMTYEIYSQLEPALTIYSGRGTVNAAFAPLEVLRALPGMDDQLARDIIEMRQSADGLGGEPLTLPDGTPIMAQGGGLTYSVRSRATLDNGISAELDATIRLGANAGRPFRILRWRDGESQ